MHHRAPLLHGKPRGTHRDWIVAELRFPRTAGVCRELTGLRRPTAADRASYAPLKRGFDLAVGVAILPIVVIIAAICAFFIWLEDGRPVLFRQDRTGLAGRRFRMYKFRTMHHDAEDQKEALAHLNQHAWPDFKVADDPRITGVGRFLRRTSLDELPQIINVLRGDMSLVGPRPTSFDASTYTLPQTERLEVLPGVTGLWQVSGRSELGFAERVVLDVQYIHQQCFTLDLQILLRTIAAVFIGRGAA